mgnify:FL=1
MNNVFGLDIGTRNVVGTVGHRTEDGAFIVEAQYVRQHETRSMDRFMILEKWRVRFPL